MYFANITLESFFIVEPIGTQCMIHRMPSSNSQTPRQKSIHFDNDTISEYALNSSNSNNVTDSAGAHAPRLLLEKP